MSGTRLWQAKMLSVRKYLQSLKLVLISVAFILLLLKQINRSWLECFLWLHRVNGTTVIYPLVNVAPCVSWGWDGHMAPQVLLLFFSNVQLALHFGRFNPIFLIYAFFKKKYVWFHFRADLSTSRLWSRQWSIIIIILSNHGICFLVILKIKLNLNPGSGCMCDPLNCSRFVQMCQSTQILFLDSYVFCFVSRKQ